MNARALVTFVLLACATASAQGTTPYNYMPFKNFSDAANPFGYYVDSRNPTPAGVSVNDVKNAADSAWAQWNAVTCAVPKSTSLGFTGSTVPQPSDPYDTFNVTPVFITDMSDPYYSNAFSYDLSAVTLPLQYAGVLQQCDIYLNGVTRQWSTAVPVSDMSLDVESVMLHEEGHCLGIDHQPAYPESVMEGDVLPGTEARVLSPTDDDILCQRYPIADGIGSPCDADGGCGGNGLGCVNQTIAGQSSARFCTNPCNLAANQACDLPLTCQPSNAFSGSSGACLRPGASETDVGAPCMMDTDCTSSIGACQEEFQGGSGSTYWLGGYCTQGCAQGDPDCPAGSTCTEVDTSAGAELVCLEACRLGEADCRLGYACAQPSGVTGGVCIPRCFSNADCASGTACRTCDGLCVNINSNAEDGAPCMADSDCGFSQQCLQIDSQSQVLLCSSPCGTGCSSCPSGSSCHPIPSAGNELFCLRDCNGEGTCPAGLQCANLPTGQGCTPPCSNDTECPLGTTCNGGVCRNPSMNADSGFCLLCPSGDDSGVTLHPNPPDSGSGNGGGGGCGCGASGQPMLAWLLLLLGRALWRRR